MQVLLRDCVPEPQVTLHGLHSDNCGLPRVDFRSPIVRSTIIIIIIIIVIIIIIIIEIVIIRVGASS